MELAKLTYIIWIPEKHGWSFFMYTYFHIIIYDILQFLILVFQIKFPW